MQQLKDRIQREGRVLPGNIIKVDGFLNHRVDTALMSVWQAECRLKSISGFVMAYDTTIAE